MPLFDYVAYDASGAKHSGQLEALTERDAHSQLKARSLLPARLQAVKSTSRYSSKSLSLKQLELFTSELHLLLESGVRLDRGIDIIRRTKADAALVVSLARLAGDMRGGARLSEALKRQPKNFDALYCNLVSLGEESGNLSEVFAGIAADLKYRRELQSKLLSVLIYPAAIFAVCILSIVFIFNFVVPRMATMFDQSAELPWYTDLVLGVSAWMQSYQWFVLMGMVTVVAGLHYYGDNAWLRKLRERWALRMPIWRSVTVMTERIKFNSGLALMLGAGLKIDRALALAIGNIANGAIRRELEVARDKIKSGESLTVALAQTSLYPPFFVSLIEVGEESNRLLASFTEISSRSRQELDQWSSRLTALIEPIMILFMGGVVGSVVVVMLLSMVSVNDFAF